MVCDGAEFPTISNENGRVWLDSRSRFWVEYYIDVETEPDDLDVDAAHNIISKLFLSKLSCDVGEPTITYEAELRRLSVRAEIFCYDG